MFHKFLPLLLVELRIMEKFGKITLHTSINILPVRELRKLLLSKLNLSRCFSAECFICVSGNYLGEEEKKMRKILPKDK